MLVQDHTSRRFRKSAEDLRWKKLFAYGKGNTRTLTVTPPGEDSEPLRLVTGPDGKMVPSPLPDGSKVNEGDLRTLVTTLETLTVKAFHPRKKPSRVGLTGEDAWRLEIGLDGGERRELLLAVKSEEEPLAVAGGGPLDGQVVSLNPFQADKLRKRSGDLMD